MWDFHEVFGWKLTILHSKLNNVSTEQVINLYKINIILRNNC